MKRYRILIVEDEEPVRERLVSLVSACSKFDLVGSAATLGHGQNALFSSKPDILLTDIGLPDGSGVELIKSIQAHHLDCEAMVISGFQDEHIVFEALQAGASSYILKHDNDVKIIDDILVMMKGGAPISPIIARLMLKKFQEQKTKAPPIHEALTARQLKILKYVSQGFSSKEIGEKLGISYYTVTTHIKNIYTKLQVNSRTEAVHEAKNLGLI